MKGRRGPRGLDGPPGDAGTGAQILSGDGPPSADPTPVTAYVLYEDTATGGNWYIWTPGSPGAWTDTGVPVSGADGLDGGNAFSITTAAFTIPTAGNFSILNVEPPNDPGNPTSSGTNWMVDFSGSIFGQTIFIEGAGYYRVAGIISTTQVAVINRRNDSTGEYQENAASGTVAAGARVSPGGLQGPAGIPVEVTSGAPNPTVDPAGGASGLYVQSGSGGTYWYFDGPSGPWTDTGIDVTGPQGDIGPGGANGHSPAVTAVTSIPVGAGTDGDIRLYQPVGNNGFTTFYYVTGGTWTVGPTVLTSRLIGYSTVSATPTGSAAMNIGDYYWCYFGGRLIFYICTAPGSPGTWFPAIDIPMTGGSGAPVDAEYIVASSNATLSNERVANSTATIVPDTTVAGQMRWNVPDDGITNAKLNNVPSNTFKGLGLGGPANPIDMTADQASVVLDTATDPFVRTSAIPGGTSTFQSISDGSPVLGDGRQTGTNVWTMQRSIQYQPRTLTIVSPLTTNLDTDYQWQRISINVVSFTLGWTGLGIDQNCEWIFEFTNDYIDAGSGLPAQTHLTYDAGRWTKNAGITQPSYINPGEVVTLHCFQRDGKMNITCVEQGVTAI